MAKRNEFMPVWHGLSLFSDDKKIWICFGDPITFKYKFLDSGEYVILPKEEWKVNTNYIDFRIYIRKDDGTYDDLGLFCDSLVGINEFLRLNHVVYGKVYYKGCYKESLVYYNQLLKKE